MRKSFVVLVLLLALALASNAFAAQTYVQWTGTAGDGNWNNGGNWNGGIVPNALDFHGTAANPGYKAGFKTAPNYANLSSGIVTTDVLVFGGTNAGNLDCLVVNGATVNVSEYITLAAGTADNGIVTMNSGTISTGVQYTNAPFYVSQSGKGTLYMNGGTINCGMPDPTWEGRPANYFANLSMTGSTTTGVGTLNLAGGIIYANDLLKGSGTASLVITGGSLVLQTDRVAEITSYIDDGWFATEEGWTIMLSYDDLEGTTTVYAVPEPATVCLLGLGAMALLRRNKK
jgi:hypothetical protein